MSHVPVPGTGTRRAREYHATPRALAPCRVADGVPVPGTGTEA
jgi:hypothetical protein